MKMKQKGSRNTWHKIILIFLFFLVLISFRFLWIHIFDGETEQTITDGELDLRDWDFSNNESITLTGEWDFYPHLLLDEPLEEKIDQPPETIEVPSDWSQKLNPDNHSPYGYGSYHLRIYVDPDEDISFSMRIPSVRSASALYANGLLVGSSGEVGESKAESNAQNVPYSSNSIRADEDGVIDIVLQGANFVDPRSSGLVRAVKFGQEEHMKKETELSSLLQLVTGVILFVHALFAILIYLVGSRDKRFVYFAVATLSLMLINVMGGDEKVLFQYIQLNYTFTYKFSMFVMILLSWSLVHTVRPQIERISKLFSSIYTALFFIGIVLIIVLPIDLLSRASNFTFGAVFLGAVITVIALFSSRANFKGSIWLSFAVIALSSHFIWWAYTMGTGMKIVYYPFDLIIAIICFAGLWFKHYHDMHEETKDQAIKLKKADKEKDEFLAITSHELRNPLHSILNMSQAVLEREHHTLQQESVQNLETVLTVSNRMSRMLDELLEMNRLKDGNPSLQLQPVSLQAVTRGVIDMVYYMVEGKDIQILNRIPINSPIVEADENRLIQIMFNLLHNAVKYTTAGKIIIDAHTEGNRVFVSIRDTGVGMNEKTMRHIFEPYTQGTESKQLTESGFGLGLNISKKLVELQGGKLKVTSSLGEGSTFTFTLPTAKSSIMTEFSTAHEETSASTDLSESNTIIAKNGSKADEDKIGCTRIIVVDDDVLNLQVVETVLSKDSYELTTVINPKSVSTLLEQQEWDLVISDVMMPQMSGFELTRQIRERFTMSELPILLLTARDRLEDMNNGFLAGANDYVTKPISALELRARVRALTKVKKTSRDRLRMESAWLQAQIQPHFLFNTINSIMALSEIDIDRMQKLLNKFSHVLRSKFDFQNLNELVPLEKELSLVHSYLHIQKERYQERLNIIWDIDDNVQALVPTLSIQPLVENAIEHGIMGLIEGGEVAVRVKNHESSITISVEDNGIGMKDEVVQSLLQTNQYHRKQGVGILNIHLRLKRLYEKGLQIDSTYHEGTIISFDIPYAEK